MWKEVTRGTGTQLGRLRDYETHLAEGQRGRVDLYMRIAPTSSILQVLQSRLQAAGVEDVRVTAGSRVIHITARKSIPFLAVIVVIVLALIILIVSWRFFKEVTEVVAAPVINAAIIAGIAVVVLIVIIVGRRYVPIGGT